MAVIGFPWKRHLEAIHSVANQLGDPNLLSYCTMLENQWFAVLYCTVLYRTRLPVPVQLSQLSQLPSFPVQYTVVCIVVWYQYSPVLYWTASNHRKRRERKGQKHVISSLISRESFVAMGHGQAHSSPWRLMFLR